MAEIFRKYYSRLAKEGFLKALLWGLIIGFSAMLITATVFWFVDFKHFWVAILVFVGISGAVTPIFYFKKFLPTTKSIAMRVDELGLEERILTMTALEGDESYIAMKQREDALKALTTVNAQMLKFAVSLPLIIATAVAGLCGMGMTTVSALSANEVIKSGKDIIEESTAVPPKQFEVSYKAEKGGMIEGKEFQLVYEGEDALPVMAIPDDDWIFVEWSDGYTDPYREDFEITKDMELTAIFAMLEDGADGFDGVPGEEGDEAGDKPSDKKGQAPPGETEAKPGEGEQTGGRYEQNNQVIDGGTYYGDEYAGAYDEAMEEVSQDAGLPGDLSEIIGDYFDSIKN